MGFLKRLFGGKKQGSSSGQSGHKPGKDKKRWSFAKSTTKAMSNTAPPTLNDFDPSTSSAPFSESLDANKHAIAVAAATAAVAEAALAAAHAAAEVVRLTSSGTGPSTSSRPVVAAHVTTSQQRWAMEVAAVKLQSAFRGYLARRALRALKALVKLQALVRGHIVRKQTADMLRRMQTLVRLQARARASRSHLSDNLHSFKSSLSHHPVPEYYDHSLRACSTKFDGSSVLKRCSSNSNFRGIDAERARFGSNWLDRWMEENVWNHQQDSPLKNGRDDEKSDKILEVDTWKPHLNSNRSSSSFQTTHYYFAADKNNENFTSYDSPSKRSAKALNQSLSSLSALKFYKGKDGVATRTAENSPQAFSASSRPATGARKGPFTPTRSECSWGFFNGYSGYPNYMANTESSKAKVRSQSAPKQRLEFERYGSATRRSVQGLWDVMQSSDREVDFRSQGYPPSSRLNGIRSTNLR
ncbi:hypothetical protein L6164_008322 [Bauhinia variegata]|uniref:Uncharacterized protein n=1 Tax=Bauhinia variegata TaxID=167791 RepID=A0ACB9PG94_BAUVA|nr:hypothetical protein L6164_008322 [Bauhinia variegata]